jgi:hypothetical protein
MLAKTNLESLIEREVIYIVNKISPDNWKYNASMFLGQDGVFKNMNVTNSEILSRSGIQNIDGALNKQFKSELPE